MNSRIISIIITTCISINAWGMYGVIKGIGEGHDVITATDMATLNLARKIETKVYAETKTSNINGKQFLIKDVTSITSLDLRDIETKIDKIGDTYIAYCSLNLDEYITKRLKEYYKYVDKSNNSQTYPRKAGYAYLAYQAINDPILDGFALENARLKERMKDIVKEIYKKRNGNLSLILVDDYNRYIIKDVPDDWQYHD